MPENEQTPTAPEPERLPGIGKIHAAMAAVMAPLAEVEEIVFNAGTHTEAIRMRWPDFAASIRPIVGKFAETHTDKVGEYRLSFRE